MEEKANAENALDYFGEILVRGFRDKALMQFAGFEKKKWTSPQDRKLQNLYSSLSQDTREVCRLMVESMLLTSLHDGLAVLQEVHDLDGRLEILVDGIDVSKASEMLNGELYGLNGWISKFSAFDLPD